MAEKQTLRVRAEMELPSLQAGMRQQVYWITRRIAQGLFVTRERALYLRTQEITDVLNVGESPSIILAHDYGFRSVRDCPVPDFRRIPDDLALACLDALQEMLRSSGSRVYVHCVAGQNRSPTILWLYFIACGMTPQAAKTLITSHTMDAVPGHPQLIDDRLVAAVVAHGVDWFLPISDPDILTPAY